MPTLPKPYRPPGYIPPKKKQPRKNVPIGFSYNSPEWREISKNQRLAHPNCQVPGCSRPAAITDHVIPISQGGDIKNPNNHGSLCHGHHNRKRGFESSGKVYEATGVHGHRLPVSKSDIYKELQTNK